MWRLISSFWQDFFYPYHPFFSFNLNHFHLATKKNIPRNKYLKNIPQKHLSENLFYHFA